MDCSMALDVIEDEPTVLEYARFHGLCRDYSQELPHLYAITPPSDETLDLDLRGPEDALPLANPANEVVKERLAVGKEAVMLLKSVFSVQEPLTDLPITSDGRRRILSLKQEVPILRTDPELDMLGFGSAMEPDFTHLRIPLEPVNEENDEGLEWPSRYTVYPAQCAERVNNEKLAVSKEILVYLQDAIRDARLPEDSEVVIEESLGYRKSAMAQPLTPPLLPLTPPLSPYIPSSPGNRLELISDDSNSTAAEARALEQQIMSADALVRHDSDGSDVMLMDTLDTSGSELTLDHVKSPPTKRKASDLKVEGPLTPPMFSETPAKKLKTVAFAETLVEYIPEFPSYEDIHDPELPSNYENGNGVLGADDDYAFYRDVIEPSAQEANSKVENEKLSEADTIKRVEVPHVDFRLPTAPWDEFACGSSRFKAETEIDAQARFLQWVKRNCMRSTTTWHGISELERTLPLAPFSRDSAKVSIEEKLHGEDVLNKLLADMSMDDIATSSTDIWKRDGLRILEDQDGEEDLLEPAELEKREDLNSLIKQRRLQLKETVDEPTSTPPHVNQHPISGRGLHESHHWRNSLPITCADATPHTTEPRQRDHMSRHVLSKHVHMQERDKNLMFGGKFSAAGALDNFMALHGMSSKSKAVAKEEAAPNRPPAPSLPLLIHTAENTHADRAAPHEPGVRLGPHAEIARLPLNLPPLPENMPPCSFIISSTLLQQRTLSKQIETMYPDAEFVSRDFESQYIASKEADLILSPSTGLILTTLQRLKQRSLPGQPDRSPVKERIISLQHMYERLVILVSEGLSPEREKQGSVPLMDSRDQETIAEYEDFASRMGGEVLVRYVPGGEQALARSIVCEMVQFGLPHGSKDIGDIRPLADQTTWELFLRRAGLNAFAAQVILALLKDTVKWPHPSDPTYLLPTCGLQTFLMMSAEQRVQSFQAVLGGSRILTRVSALLDQPWVSAAHGFRI